MYDVAVSYASERRPYVAEVVRHLKDLGLSVFYDEDPECMLRLWGRDMTLEFADIYNTESHYCIMFICKYYVKKKWTSYEQSILRARQLNEITKTTVSILPARFDDTQLPEVPPTFGYISLADLSPHDFALLAYTKISGSKLFSLTPFYTFMGQRNYEDALAFLKKLEETNSAKLDAKQREWLRYNCACCYSRLASKANAESNLAQSLRCVTLWFDNISLLDRETLQEYVQYFNHDDDLLPLRQSRRKELKNLLALRGLNVDINVKPIGGGGCFPAGTLILTPTGSVPIESLKPGCTVISFDAQQNLCIRICSEITRAF